MAASTEPAVLVLQHHEKESLGHLGRILGQSHVRLVQGYRGEPVPATLGDARGLVLLGGPQSVNQTAQYPFLRQEMRLLEQALGAGLPVLGICLGSQLLAAVLGARVSPAARAEIGWYPLQLTADDPMFAGIPRQFIGLHWHAENFELPAGAIGLASSALTPHQAFQIGGKAYGLLFHLEITAPQLAAMVQAFGEELAQARVDGPAVLSQAARYERGLERIGQRVFGYWAALAGLPGPPLAPKVIC